MVAYRGLSLVDLRPEHVFAFRPHSASIEEMKKVYHRKLKPAVMARMKHDKCYAVVDDQGVYAITGIAPDGSMWCLFSELIDGNFIRMARASKALIEFYHERHPTIVCDIWEKNDNIMQWLAMLGFTPRFKYWHDDHCLYRFVRCADERVSGSTQSVRPVIS